MAVGLWGRLTLRTQAVVAVLLPCVAVALFASMYFPARLNAQAEHSLERRALSLGALASAELSPTVRLINDGFATAEDVDKIFEGVVGFNRAQHGAQVSAEVDLSDSDVAFLAVLRGADAVLPVNEKTLIRKSGGTLPIQQVAVPALRDETGRDVARRCELDRGSHLVLRCAFRDQDAPGVFVAAFRMDELRMAQRENQSVGLWSGIGAGILGLVLAVAFSRALVAPVALVTQAAREVASGDVTVQSVEVSAAAEIRSMAGSFNEMLSNLRGLVGQMVSLTGRLSEASQGLIGASRAQENVTSQQAAYAQEIAATFEELSRTAEQISASTDVVETAARNTKEAVEQARAVVAEMVHGIDDIRDESDQVAEAIRKLNADLQQVSRIAQVINAVAERSDLLALNAALEGTKAGEVGRGFSLVAAEMRKLAESVSGSAQDIGRIVDHIHDSGHAAEAKAREGMAASARGVEVAGQASAVFERIVELARGTTEAAQQIAIATRQQRASSEQAVKGARNVADLVKEGVDATGRTNRIAQDLQQVAQALADVTGKFKVERAAGTSKEPPALSTPPPEPSPRAFA